MFHYYGVVQNRAGDAQAGAFVEVTTAAGVVVPIYSDDGVTPIFNVSGVTNRAKADALGNFDFYVVDGNYNLNYYSSASVLLRTQRGVPIGTSTVSALAVGTAAAPSVSFNTDQTTGMFLPTASVVAWSTGGVERARITAARLDMSVPIRLRSYTFATLPASPSVGDMAVITDSNTVVFNAAAAGGGINAIKVCYLGGSWKVA
jgi:hypothetical protein